MKVYYGLMDDGTTCTYTGKNLTTPDGENVFVITSPIEYSEHSIYHPKNRAKAVAEGKLTPEEADALD